MKVNMDKVSFFFLMGVMGAAALAGLAYAVMAMLGK